MSEKEMYIQMMRWEAAEEGNTSLLQVLIEEYPIYPCEEETIGIAILNGHLHTVEFLLNHVIQKDDFRMLQYLFLQSKDNDKGTDISLVEEKAKKHNSIKILEWIKTQEHSTA